MRGRRDHSDKYLRQPTSYDERALKEMRAVLCIALLPFSNGLTDSAREITMIIKLNYQCTDVIMEVRATLKTNKTRFSRKLC